MSATKKCSRCKLIKPIRGFYKWALGHDNLQNWCRSCAKEQNLIKSLNKFDLSLDEYDQLQKDQNRLCGICFVEEGKTLCIDHDHITNKVRGLLCSKCNRGLGLLGDSIESIKSTLKYLEKCK